MKNSGNTKEINMGRYHTTMNHEAAGQGKGECIWLHNWTENMFKYIPLAGCAGYNNSVPYPMTCRVVLSRRFWITKWYYFNANNLVQYLVNQKIATLLGACIPMYSWLCQMPQLMRVSLAGATLARSQAPRNCRARYLLLWMSRVSTVCKFTHVRIQRLSRTPVQWVTGTIAL